LFDAKFFIYTQHIGRDKHQSNAAERVIKSIVPTEIALLIDWSMNYVCKYKSEPQSVHFGGSHAQVALHTGRLYKNGGRAESFCTLSEITRHDPKAITAHLKPVLEKFLTSSPLVNKVVFVSDGPVTQYRNRELYFLITQYLTKMFPQILEIE